MSQPPPWETQPQPGWGPPPPPSQQPGGDGAWGQGPYSPQQQYPQNPYPADYPPYRPGDDEPPRKGRNSGRTAGIVGTAILLVAGTVTVVALTHGHGGSGSPNAAPTQPTAAAPATTGTMTFPDNSFPSSGAPSGATSPPQDRATTPGGPDSATSVPGGVDPASLDSAATDKTPFTAAGLVAAQFKDDKNVVYKLVAAAPKPCDKVGDPAVATIVKSAKCTQLLAASWTDASGRIIVSAMVVPYADVATAKRISDKLGTTAHTGDYNQWCPPPGQPHADVCAKLTPAATREGKFGSFHRYLLITTAVYSDLRNDDTQKDWLVAAAGGAFQNTLPGM